MTLFVYGTLQLDAVMEAVTGRRFERTAAVLEGYRRRRVRSRAYPAITPSDHEGTEGVVFRGLDDETLRRLDVFEGDLYERRQLPVQVEGEGSIDAWVYVLAPEHAGRLSDQPWDLEDFAVEHGEAFALSCRRSREHGVT